MNNKHVSGSEQQSCDLLMSHPVKRCHSAVYWSVTPSTLSLCSLQQWGPSSTCCPPQSSPLSSSPVILCLTHRQRQAAETFFTHLYSSSFSPKHTLTCCACFVLGLIFVSVFFCASNSEPLLHSTQNQGACESCDSRIII